MNNLTSKEMIKIINKQETLEEKRKFLIKIGLIDENGKLTKTYTTSNNISRATTQNKPYNNPGQTMKTIKDFKEFFTKVNLDENTEVFVITDDGKVQISDIQIEKFIKIANGKNYEEYFDDVHWEGSYLWVSTNDYDENYINETVEHLDILEVKIKIALNPSNKEVEFDIRKKSTPPEWEKIKENNLSPEEYENTVLRFLKTYGVGESKRGFSPWALLEQIGGTEVKMRTALGSLEKKNLIYRTGTTKSTMFVFIAFKDIADCTFNELQRMHQNVQVNATKKQ